jgi:hypothetical protein
MVRLSYPFDHVRDSCQSNLQEAEKGGAMI